jgi:hypothetical protein
MLPLMVGEYCVIETIGVAACAEAAAQASRQNASRQAR